MQKSHLLTSNPGSRGPAGNRFGEGRFVTFEGARQYLRQLMVQPITGNNLLKGFKHPIVIMGHAVGHDREHLMGKDLGFNMGALGTVVKFIDTQTIARELGHWLDPQEFIGLDRLVAKLDFEHKDPHTAANDAGRTIMCGMLLVLDEDVRKGCSRSIEQVASDAEHYSRNTFVGLAGTREYCCKCGSTQHMYTECKVPKEDLYCAECEARGLTNDDTIWGHITLHCVIKRDEVAAERLKWYKEQLDHWKPKWAFDSSYYLQTFQPNAPRIAPDSPQEIKERREFYHKKQGPWDVKNVWTWEGRSFNNSPLKAMGAPSRQQATAPRDASGRPIRPQPAAPAVPPANVPQLPAGGHFPPLPGPSAGRGANNPSRGGRGGRNFAPNAPRGRGYGGGGGRGFGQ